MTGRVEHSSGNARTLVHAGFDRDKAREIVSGWLPYPSGEPLELRLDALAGCFDAPTTINRDELEEVLWDWRAAILRGGTGDSFTVVADRILALLRPDPRIAQLEEFLHRAETQGDVGVIMPTAIENIRKILRGEDA